MNTIIILNQPYPFGMACTKRIHLYAKALIEQGQKIKIIIPRPKLKSGDDQNIQQAGEHNGVSYSYVCHPVRSQRFLNRRILDIISPLKACYACLKLKPDSLLLVSTKNYHYVLFWLTSVILNCRFYKETNEIAYSNRDQIHLFHKLFLKIRYSIFDGFVVISEEIRDFLRIDLGLKKAILVVPVIYDYNKPLPLTSYNDSGYLLYTGSLLERKDGIITLLKSLAIAKKSFQGIRLLITGYASQSPDYINVLKIINELNIKDNVRFTGYVDEDTLIQMMLQAKLLMLAKPANRQNYYNFPSKIAEYLYSGTPVLMTNVGPSKKYLKDMTNVFLADNADEFSEKIKFVLMNPEKAGEIAVNGKNTGRNEFHYQNYSKELSRFFSKT